MTIAAKGDRVVITVGPRAGLVAQVDRVERKTWKGEPRYAYWLSMFGGVALGWYRPHEIEKAQQ